MGGRQDPTVNQQNLLQQQQRDMAAQLQAVQRQANQYEFQNLGLLTQQLQQRTQTEARVAEQMQGLVNASTASRNIYQSILGDLSALQAQQYGLNQQRTLRERNFSQQELAQAAALNQMVVNRTRLAEAAERNALTGFQDLRSRYQNQAQLEYNNYRMGSTQVRQPWRLR